MPHRIRFLAALVGIAVFAASTGFSNGPSAKWPPRLTFDAPVNSNDPAARGAVMLVHALLHDGVPQASELTGSAEGLINGERRSVSLAFIPMRQPGSFAVRRQWPTEGVWLIRVSLRSTTELVTLDGLGRIGSVHQPREERAMDVVPASILQHGVDSILTLLAKGH